jgi:hypothetical protein
MREALAIQQMTAAGFVNIQLQSRLQVNALLTALKPA